MTKLFVLSVSAACTLGVSMVALATEYPLQVRTEPSGALLSVHANREAITTGSTRKVAGETPVDKRFEFPKGNVLWLELEKRGYVAQVIEVTPEAKSINVKLEKIKDTDGGEVGAYAFPSIKRLLVVTPEFEVIKRGFASEEVAHDDCVAAQDSLVKSIRTHFAGNYEVAVAQASENDLQTLKSLWRDAKTAMELTDPIRLKYLSLPPRLQTKSARKAASNLGVRYGTQAILLLSGKMNREKASMVLGKIGLFAAGTASSYASGYASAVERGDSFFVYTVYVPRFDQGTLLRAMLVDSVRGEIIWLNQGIWGVIDFGSAEEVDKMMEELLSGLKPQKQGELR